MITPHNNNDKEKKLKVGNIMELGNGAWPKWIEDWVGNMHLSTIWYDMMTSYLELNLKLIISQSIVEAICMGIKKKTWMGGKHRYCCSTK